MTLLERPRRAADHAGERLIRDRIAAVLPAAGGEAKSQRERQSELERDDLHVEFPD